MLELKNKEWKPGDWIYINKMYWGKNEIDEITKVLSADWFAGNSITNKKFEELICNFSGLKYFQTTNSGSSALEISLDALVHMGKLKRGDKILHPVLTFPTSISHAIRLGLIPVFVDVGEGTYVVDEDSVQMAFEEHPDIAAAIIPALLGNSPHIDLLLSCLAGKPLIIDSCDTMGTKWDDVELVKYGDFGCYSFYPSHHITTAVGGGLGTDDDELYNIAKSMAFWGRNDRVENEDRLTSFLKRYTYTTIGHDSQMSALLAAIGIAQMCRLDVYIFERDRIFKKLQKLFSSKMDYFVLPRRVSDRADVSWFCYPVIIKDNAPFTREDVINYLLDNKIEIRPPMTNLLDNEIYRKQKYITAGDFKNAQLTYNNGFFIGAYPMEAKQEECYFDVLGNFLKKW